MQKGQAYIGAFRPNDDNTTVKVIVSFRGTENLENWIENLDIAKTDHAMSCKGCKAHSGFVNMWTAFSNNVIRELRRLRSLYPGAKLFITGHSLGAAVALIAGYSLQYDIGFDVAGVYTYGSPRVGNQAFSDFLDGKGRQQQSQQPQQLRSAFGSPQRNATSTLDEADTDSPPPHGPFSPFPYWRMTHGRDPVPHLPPRWIGFMHVATEIFFRFDNHSHVVCDGSGEDKTCSNQFWMDVSVYDHLHYYGEETGIVAC